MYENLYLLLRQIALVMIWNRPRARTETPEIHIFCLFVTPKMAFPNGKNKKRVVFFWDP